MIEHFKKQLDEKWIPILTPLIEDSRFETILSTIVSSKGFEPNIANLFKAFKACPYDDLKVVILGQDPYPQQNVATGLAFGYVGDKTPASLQIILEELSENIEEYNEWLFLDKQSLEHWANQGVLLLNSALSVELNLPGSHQKVWKYFIEGLLRELSIKNTAIVYVLLGKVAQSFEPFIRQNTNYILKAAHPAADTYRNERIFRGSKIFNKIDNIVHSLYGHKINWL